MGKRKAMEQAAEVKEEEQQHEEGETSEEEGSSDSGSDVSDDSGDSDDSAPEVSDEGEEDSPDEDAFNQINVDFQFFDPKEADFHGLKALLHTYLDGQQYDSSPLVETIIAQSSVGTVVRTGEDEDPIGVMSVLNTQQYSQAAFMGQIKQYMLDKCSNAADREKLSKAWDGPGCGLLLNERLMNCPPQLAPPLTQALFDEVDWATEDQPTQELRDFFKFKHYVLMTRVYSDPLSGQQPDNQPDTSAAAAGPSSGKPPAGPKKQQQQQQQQQKKKQKGEQQQAAAAAVAAPVIVYVRPEDEFFHARSSLSYTFPVDGRAVGRDELQPLRLVMLLPASQVKPARDALDAVIGNMAAQQ